MFNGAAVPEGSADDLTTRARIRDAAIVLFGEQGFGVGVRAIAAAAGVSPGLVNHHFGSKEGLRGACDDHVRALIKQAKLATVEKPGPTSALQSLAEIEEFAPYVAYLMRSFQTGGALMAEMFESLIADMEEYLTVGIKSGTIRPLRDVKAMARYLGMQNGGGFLFFLQMYVDRHRGDGIDYGVALREYANTMMLPALEMATNGLLADSTLLDAVLAQQTSHQSENR